MAFILLTNGFVYEVTGTRAQVVTAIGQATAGSADAQVLGAPMTFRTAAVIAVAETKEQVDSARPTRFDPEGPA